jgi:GntR family transcriptional regulator, transcriptional repressor for pyruvate dehydrogenase complex
MSERVHPKALRPLVRQRLHDGLIERLAEFVDELHMERGDRFPAERELAAQLQVSRASVRQATVALEALGFLEIRHGGGVYLRRAINFGESFAALFEKRRAWPEALEAREVLEVKLAEFAAIRRADDEIEPMHKTLERMETDLEAGNSGLKSDSQFHALVAKAAHNSILERALAELSTSIDDMRAEYLADPARRTAALALNRELLAQIQIGIPQLAAQAMQTALRDVAAFILASWDQD